MQILSLPRTHIFLHAFSCPYHTYRYKFNFIFVILYLNLSHLSLHIPYFSIYSILYLNLLVFQGFSLSFYVFTSIHIFSFSIYIFCFFILHKRTCPVHPFFPFFYSMYIPPSMFSRDLRFHLTYFFCSSIFPVLLSTSALTFFHFFFYYVFALSIHIPLHLKPFFLLFHVFPPLPTFVFHPVPHQFMLYFTPHPHMPHSKVRVFITQIKFHNAHNHITSM